MLNSISFLDNPLIMKRLFYSLVSLFVLSIMQAKAQDGFDQLIKSGPADATKLVQAYAEPLFKGIGYGMNSGWYHSAQAKKPLRFDIKATATMAMIPNNDKTFDVTQIGLSDHVRPASTQHIAQTFGGDKNITGPTMNIYDDKGNKISSFDMPSGQMSFVPTPQIQLVLGLVKNTDVSVRYVPETKFSDDVGSIQMFGVGLRHDIIQDFGKAGKLIPIDLALAFGFNKINYTKTLNVQPEGGAQPVNNQQSTDFSNQRIDGHFNSFIFEAIVSKKLLFFTPFFSVGYNTAKTNVGLLGNYPITSTVSVGNNSQKFYTTYKDPVSIKEKNVSGARADIGFQLNFFILKLFASYSLTEYHAVNGGLALGI